MQVKYEASSLQSRRRERSEGIPEKLTTALIFARPGTGTASLETQTHPFIVVIC